MVIVCAHAVLVCCMHRAGYCRRRGDCAPSTVFMLLYCFYQRKQLATDPQCHNVCPPMLQCMALYVMHFCALEEDVAVHTGHGNCRHIDAAGADISSSIPGAFIYTYTCHIFAHLLINIQGSVGPKAGWASGTNDGLGIANGLHQGAVDQRAVLHY